jgi:hypothetical protein
MVAKAISPFRRRCGKLAPDGDKKGSLKAAYKLIAEV